MAEATLTILLKDLATKGIASVKGAIDQFRSGLLAAGAAVGGFTAFMVGSLSAYAESEAAVGKLNVALKNVGVTSGAVSKDLQNFAGQLARSTTFTDEAIIESQALLVSFGLMGDKLKSTTKAALDLSSGLGVDLRTATLLLGKTAEGSSEGLKRYGISIKEGVAPSEMLSLALGQINSKFGGSAVAQMATFSGQMENLKNRFGEFSEVIGKELLPVANFWTGVLDTWLSKVEELVVAEERHLTGRQLTIAALEEQMIAIDVAAAKRGGDFTQEETQQMARLEAAKAREQELLAHKTKTEQAKLELEKNRVGQSQVLAQQETLFKLKQQQITLSNTQQAFGIIASAQNAKTKEVVAVAKAASIAQSIIGAWRAYVMALANPPGPPFSIPQAKVALGLGLAATAVQAAVTLGLQEGGVVMPGSQRLGQVVRVAEGGGAEAVIPLEDERAKEKLRDVFGGGSAVNITINAGASLIDSASLSEFAKRIDEELFRLSRNGESLILGPNDVRGA